MNRLAPCLPLVLLALLISPKAVTASDDRAAWIRYPRVSPDGTRIAFSFQGDIWVVPATGGAARMLTSHEGYERSPVWSPDSRTIAFMADWNDGGDVYTVPVAGGPPTRLTFHSATDVPTAFMPGDDGRLLFTSRRQDAPDAVIGSSGFGELYSIPVDGGRPRQLLTTTAEHAHPSPAGDRIVFYDYKGFEDPFRKHHTSSVTRDVWMLDLNTGQQTRLSGFRGEDRDPVFSADGKSVYFLSEQVQATAPGDEGKNLPQPAAAGDPVIPQLASSMNVWKLDPADPSRQTRITGHTTHPVRGLSVAGDGTLCYGYNGQVWVRRPGEEPAPVEIGLRNGLRSNDTRRRIFRDSVTEFAVSPNEEEIAFVVRGEVFVVNVEFGTTRRITATPAQERSVSWGADNRTLYYAGERDHSWNIYKSTIDRDDEDGFAHATLVTETPVMVTGDESFQPVCSPDGNQLAWLKNRTEIMITDLQTGDSRTLVPADRNFSYTDGDISYAWSPDSNWLTMTWHGHASWVPEIGAVNIETGEIVNLTDSGYAEEQPMFAAGGKALLYASNRYGERSHGSWGGENDVIAVYLTQDAWDEATLDQEQLALKKKREEKDRKKDKDQEPADPDGEDSNGEDKDAEDKDAEDKDQQVEPIGFETVDLDLRRRRLTLHSSSLGSFDLTPDGEHLVYTCQVDDKWGLWVCQVRDRSTRNVLPLPGGESPRLHLSGDGKTAFLLQGGKLSTVDLAAVLKGGGKAASKPVGFAAEMEVSGSGERQYIFDHAWRQVRDKFYDENLHGVDWQAMYDNYAAFLPSINNNHDFAELLSEMLGELNASHTGCRYRPRRQDVDRTASLGLLYDTAHDGTGLKVAEVIRRGPCDRASCQIAPGTVITHINGHELTENTNPWKRLNWQAGRPLRLALSHDGRTWEETVRPISAGEETNLMYERWIAGCRDRCEEWSDGRIGYVHVRGMNDGSFRRVFSEVLGKNNEKEALIVDTRFNGGGWLHEDLATFLDGELYVRFAPRGFEGGGLGGEPIHKWTRPVAVLQSESNYSDAHFFPWAFREKGVGKLVGSAVPGTATAVWWETQIDPELVFGIPQVGMLARDGKYLENNQLEPDVHVLNDPPAMAAGQDPQLEKAVEMLLEQLDRTN